MGRRNRQDDERPDEFPAPDQDNLMEQPPAGSGAAEAAPREGPTPPPAPDPGFPWAGSPALDAGPGATEGGSDDRAQVATPQPPAPEAVEQQLRAQTVTMDAFSPPGERQAQAGDPPRAVYADASGRSFTEDELSSKPADPAAQAEKPEVVGYVAVHDFVGGHVKGDFIPAGELSAEQAERLLALGAIVPQYETPQAGA